MSDSTVAGSKGQFVAGFFSWDASWVVRFMEVSTGKVVFESEPRPLGGCLGVEASPDGRLVFAHYGKDRLLAIRCEQWSLTTCLQPPKVSAESFTTTDDGSYLIAAGVDGIVRVLQTSDWSEVARMQVKRPKTEGRYSIKLCGPTNQIALQFICDRDPQSDVEILRLDRSSR